MTWFVRETLERIIIKLRESFPERIKGLYVYGSRIREGRI